MRVVADCGELVDAVVASEATGRGDEGVGDDDDDVDEDDDTCAFCALGDLGGAETGGIISACSIVYIRASDQYAR
jgi:hypothetical protein